jgi:hypothetical protein
MQEANLFQIFTSPLNNLGVRYMVTGAVASIIYGEPRLTHDIDLVMEIHAKNAEELVSAFPPKEFYCPPVEVIRLEIGRPLRGHINIIHNQTGFKADMYMMGQDELHHWAMPKRKEIQVGTESLWVAPPEYVILRKLEYYREGHSEKHMTDIKSIIELSADQLDFQEINKKVVDYGLQNEWEQARQKI